MGLSSERRRFVPGDKQWCVILSLMAALGWSYMDLLAGLNREVVEGATITAVTGSSICLLGIVAFFACRDQRKVGRLTCVCVCSSVCECVCVSVCVCVDRKKEREREREREREMREHKEREGRKRR